MRSIWILLGCSLFLIISTGEAVAQNSNRDISWLIRAFELTGAHRAAATGDTQTLIQILESERKKDLVQTIASLFGRYEQPWERSDKKSGMTPLGWAILGGHLVTVEILVHQYHAKLNKPDKNGGLPIEYGALVGENEIIRFLIINGADVNGRYISSVNNGWTALFFASIFANKDTFILLLEHGADPSIRDKKNRSVYDFVKELDQVLNLKSKDPGTLLILICNMGSLHTRSLSECKTNIKIIREILEDQRINIDVIFPKEDRRYE